MLPEKYGKNNECNNRHCEHHIRAPRRGPEYEDKDTEGSHNRVFA
jgi:hypothetical protein